MIWVIMGSQSDESIMAEACLILKENKIKFEKIIMSAHRQPEKLRKKIKGARKAGVKIIIAGAGFAAALPGFIASHTSIPVLGVPIPSSPLKGIDALFSIVQMPSGIPVATFGIGKSGAKNAALFAVRLLKKH